MNAVTGDNPESGAVTEVTRIHAEQAPQAGPMSIGDSQSGGQPVVIFPDIGRRQAGFR